jgi:hypothetical protein
MALSARELTLAAWVSVGELTLMHRSLTFDPLLRRLSALRAATIHAVLVQPMVFSLRAAVLRVALPHILRESGSRVTPRGCPLDASRPTHHCPGARALYAPLSARTAICHRFRTHFLSVRADAHRESAKRNWRRRTHRESCCPSARLAHLRFIVESPVGAAMFEGLWFVGKGRSNCDG